MSFARKNAEESISEDSHDSDQQNTDLSSINVNSCGSVGQLDNNSNSVPSQNFFSVNPLFYSLLQLNNGFFNVSFISRF